MAAAWAALRAGHDVDFYAKGLDKSQLFGCQYLHAPIPLPRSYNIASAKVEYKLVGTAEEYRAKVYGGSYKGRVSPEDLEGEHYAWDIRATYDALWSIITSNKRVSIYPVGITASWLAASTTALSRYAHVISTIPAFALCDQAVHHPAQEGHYFASHSVKARGGREGYPFGDTEGDVIVCDGTDAVAWYRSAVVFGYRTTEWPRTFRPGIGGLPIVSVRKPLQTDCDCHPEIIRLGRYGQWKKGVLVHQVFQAAEKLMNGEWA
jgi:hypothetical protein